MDAFIASYGSDIAWIFAIAIFIALLKVLMSVVTAVRIIWRRNTL